MRGVGCDVREYAAAECWYAPPRAVQIPYATGGGEATPNPFSATTDPAPAAGETAAHLDAAGDHDRCRRFCQVSNGGPK